MAKFKVGDAVEIKTKDRWNGRVGEVYEVYKNVKSYVVKFNPNESAGFDEGELELIQSKLSTNEVGRFEKIATELGQFTDMKNKQYGSSVDATYEMSKVLMERYTHDEDNYLIPKSLLSHLLLMVRVMDKQNRIFNNPSGKGDSESPWKDILGYSLIGVDMVERNK